MNHDGEGPQPQLLEPHMALPKTPIFHASSIRTPLAPAEVIFYFSELKKAFRAAIAANDSKTKTGDRTTESFVNI